MREYRLLKKDSAQRSFFFAWYGITGRNLRRNSMAIHLFHIFVHDPLSALINLL